VRKQKKKGGLGWDLATILYAKAKDGEKTKMGAKPGG